MIEPVFSLLFGINSWLLKLRRTPHAADRFSYDRCANALILKAHVGTTHKSHGFRSFGIRSRRALNRRYSLIYWLFVYLCVKSRKRTVYDKISHLIRERYVRVARVTILELGLRSKKSVFNGAMLCTYIASLTVYIHIVHHFRFEIQIIIICIVSDWCLVFLSLSRLSSVFWCIFPMCVCIHGHCCRSLCSVLLWMHKASFANDEWLKCETSKQPKPNYWRHIIFDSTALFTAFNPVSTVFLSDLCKYIYRTHTFDVSAWLPHKSPKSCSKSIKTHKMRMIFSEKAIGKRLSWTHMPTS